MNRIVLLALLVGCAEEPLPQAPPPVGATPADVLYDLGQQADAVFSGRVVSIEYRESDPNSQGVSWPHTFVTWEVERAFKGVEPGQSFTARFIGGPTDDGSRILRVSELPVFGPGDTDLLFVGSNEASACPLVGCAQGRLRIARDRVYREDGAAFVLGPDGALAMGGAGRLPELSRVEIDGIDLTPIQGSIEGAVEEGPGTPGLERGRFEAQLDRILGDLSQAPLAESADIHRPFSIEP